MDDRIHLADMGKKTVAQALALGGACHESCNIDKLNGGRNYFGRVDEFRDRLKTRVGHLNDADVRVDSAERIVLRLRAGVGQRIKEGRLTDVGQAHNAAAKAHSGFSFLLGMQNLHHRFKITSNQLVNLCYGTVDRIEHRLFVLW